MSAVLETLDLYSAVAKEAVLGLTSLPKSLPAWLFYDAHGTLLFEKITCLPEYYLTRTERDLLSRHAGEMIELAAGGGRLTLVELGAGTATKTGILLSAAVQRQKHVIYQPIDVSATALAMAKAAIETDLIGIHVQPQVADYTTEPLNIRRDASDRVLLVYLGSSIGNFTLPERRRLLNRLREQLLPGDQILIGADLIKSEKVLLPAYDDADQITAAFNLNVLARLNREVGTNFDLYQFEHLVVWNSLEKRIEMHLESQRSQRVTIPGLNGGADVTVHFAAGETIHTENSYKFTTSTMSAQLVEAGFMAQMVWNDPDSLYSLTLAETF